MVGVLNGAMNFLAWRQNFSYVCIKTRKNAVPIETLDLGGGSSNTL
jgi:hypothetical protein